MAKFTHSNFEPTAKLLHVSEDGKTVFLNNRGTVSISIAGVSVSIVSGDREVDASHTRSVVTAPHGATLLPYFIRGEEVRVVMVEQFRIALCSSNLEAAGGEADEENVRASMARELEEEARITVSSESIKLVYGAYIQPSMMASMAFGGIVRISEDELPKELLGGEHQFGEFTVLSVRPLVPLLKARDAGDVTLDLETSRLLDAVAETVGLITRHY